MTTTSSPHSRRSSSLLRRLLFGVCAFLGFALSVAAQSAGTGIITGRVLNTATGEYIRNAEVRVEGTAQVAISEDGGFYRLANVAPGAVTLVATYTGHDKATATVNVAAGAEPVIRDFELVPTGANRTASETVKLGAFVVSTEREGQAKAISEQKNAMNVKNVVASDNFGDIAEGNVGEFLKFMPGITLDYVETDTRAARMGGMEARYGYVTIDGNTAANTFSGGSFGVDQRQFEFETVSINNIDSIEVNKTLSADMPGDAPAGTINLRTKSALDRKRPQFNYSVSLIGNQYEYSLHSTPRHDDHTHPKSRPSATVDYSSGPLLGGKIGFSINSATTSVFKEQFRNSMTYDYTSAQAIAAKHPLVTAINFKDGPKMTTKYSGGVSLDYQPFRSLRLNGSLSYTYFSDVIANRNLNFRVSSTESNTNADLTKIVATPTANANTRLEQSGSHGNKKSDNTNPSFSFTYKGTGPLSADGSLALSRARIQNGSLHMGAVDNANVQLTRIGWTAERPNNDSSAWYITQTPGTVGGSWYDLNNWGRSDTQAGNITNSRARGQTEQYTGRVNFKYVTSWKLPTYFQSGLYEQVANRRGDNNYQNTYTYVGPTGNQLTSPLPVSQAYFRFDQWGSNVGNLPVPDKAALFQLQYTNPSYFTQTAANNVTNLETILSSPHSNQETVKSTYLQATTKWGKWNFRIGERYEGTDTISELPIIVPVSKNPYAIKNANGTFTAPTTSTDYIYYKYSKGMSKSYGSYDDFLPSASAKYQITNDLNLKLGYNKALKRPNLSQVAGAWSINAADTQITIPNPALTPEHSETFSAVLEYYFEPAGAVSLHAFARELKGATETFLQTAEEAGYGNDPIYGSYDFITYRVIPGTTKMKGLELSYSQQFTFLRSEYLRGIGIFASYSRYNRNPRPTSFTPQNATGGFNYGYKRFKASISGTYTDESAIAVPLTSTLNRGDVQYLKQRVICDINASYRFDKHTSIFLAGRNAFNEGKSWYFKSDHRMQMKEKYGGQWTIGVKGTY